MLYRQLQNVMDAKGLNIPDVVKLTGVPDGTIRYLMKRKSKTSALDVAVKLSRGLNVSIAYLNGEADTASEEYQWTTMDSDIDAMKDWLRRKMGRCPTDAEQKFLNDILSAAIAYLNKLVEKE